jgi:hypothetical protein
MLHASFAPASLITHHPRLYHTSTSPAVQLQFSYVMKTARIQFAFSHRCSHSRQTKAAKNIRQMQQKTSGGCSMQHQANAANGVRFVLIKRSYECNT